MSTHTLIDDLFLYNTWAHGRIFKLCEGLTDSQLDEPRDMGFGSLRNTLFHILAAEEIWLERWNSIPWRPFETEAKGLPLAEIARRLEVVSAGRKQLMDRERDSLWRRDCEYKDSKGNAYRNRLDGLLMHVANHGIHHRAQALSYLKQFGRTVPGGLDYIFFRFASPVVKQEQATIDSMRQFGMEVETGTGLAVGWSAPWVSDYFAYGDWANDRLLSLVEPLDDAALNRSFGIGVDTIRKTVLHIVNAERWWLNNWTIGPSMYEKPLETTSITELRSVWNQTIPARNQFLNSLDEASAQRVLTALVGPMQVRVPVIEAAVQLGGHGTHHRAQLINMLRQTGVTPPACDLMVWLRERNSIT